MNSEGAFRQKIGTLSLDLKSPVTNDGLEATRLENPPSNPALDLTPGLADISAAQKQYAQGFFDALRSVHAMNNFDSRKTTLLSPTLVPALISSTELRSPFAATPTNSSDMNAIMQALLPTPSGSGGGIPTSNPGLPSPFSIFPGPPLPTIPCSSQMTPTSANTSIIIEKPAEPEPRVEPPRIEIKQETVLSEDSTDNMSDGRSRSSSVALSQTHSNMREEYGVSMDDQERKKLERKRARNRQAASKCRQKKMDKIQELEQVVNNEKSRGQNLDAELQRLHGTLQQLQRLMERHAARGSCPSHMSS